MRHQKLLTSLLEKKIFLFFPVLTLIWLSACNNEQSGKTASSNEQTTQEPDSIETLSVRNLYCLLWDSANLMKMLNSMPNNGKVIFKFYSNDLISTNIITGLAAYPAKSQGQYGEGAVPAFLTHVDTCSVPIQNNTRYILGNIYAMRTDIENLIIGGNPKDTISFTYLKFVPYINPSYPYHVTYRIFPANSKGEAVKTAGNITAYGLDDEGLNPSPPAPPGQ